MPSRLGVALILFFWLATTALVGYREVWPRLTAGTPPAVASALTDEAAPNVPARWGVYRGTEKVGGLTTSYENVAADDSFRFVSAYRDLHFDVGQVTLRSPDLTTVLRMTRAGELREQRLTGELRAAFAGQEYVARADVTGTVVDGKLVGRCQIDSPLGKSDRPLDPVPVPAGQVLNPLMPLARLGGVHGGMRPWKVRPVDPLADAVAGMVQQATKNSQLTDGVLGAGAGDRELLAVVRPAAERLKRKGGDVDCWVIDYRGAEVAATTWVAVADGKVLRQQAAGFGEQLTFERED